MKILVLSIDFSGVTKSIIQELRSKEITVVDIPVIRIPFLRMLSVLLGFSFFINKWKSNSIRIHGELNATYFAFKIKSWFVSRAANKIKHKFDAILQISATFSFDQNDKKRVPHYLLTDYTMQLAIKHNPALLHRNRMRLWLKEEKKLYNKVAAIFIPAKYLIDYFQMDYDVLPSKCTVIGYGSKFPVQTKEHNHNCKKILFVGKDFDRKGGNDLLAAFAIVRENIPDAELIIVGPAINPAENMDGVSFFGHVNDPIKLQNIYRQCSIFAMPSHHEPFGLVFLEAMANGLVCIGSSIDAMPEIMSNSGFTIEKGNIKELASEISKLLLNPLLVSELSKLSQEKINAHYNWSDVSDAILARIKNDSENVVLPVGSI
jgi:glycosyltransferase involved in cell wall biosynthesis